MHLHGKHSQTALHSSVKAEPLHAFVLLLGSCLPVLGTVLIAPVLPLIQAHFSGVAQIEILAPLALTIPALFIGLLAPIAGVIADAFGRKRLLVLAMILYGFLGTAPIWLDSLTAIIVSRAGVGLAEAAIMTCCTTLLADYFDGVKREQYLALQTVWTTTASMIFIFVGGFLGEFGWKTPFWLYFASFGVALLMYLVLFEPKRVFETGTVRVRQLDSGSDRVWGKLLYICAITFLGAIAFFTVQVELGFLLNARGVSSTQSIGLAIGLGAGMVMIGALVIRKLSHPSVPLLLTLGFSLTGAGFVTMGSASTFPGIVTGVLVHGLGAGLLLPTLVMWVMRILGFEQRGRGSGAWNSSFFIGQFACPFVVLTIMSLTGGLPDAIVAMGWVFVATGAAALSVCLYRVSRHQDPVVDQSS